MFSIERTISAMHIIFNDDHNLMREIYAVDWFCTDSSNLAAVKHTQIFWAYKP